MIYLDNNASTQVDLQVLHEMLPWFTDQYGNPSSTHHAFGWAAEAAIEKARGQLADLLAAQSTEIIFTSGATEANNLAIFGVMERLHGESKHFVTCVTEHPSVLGPADRLEKSGIRVTRVAVDQYGLIDETAYCSALSERPGLVSVMLANNESGVVQNIPRLAEMARSAGVHFHTDATQGVGKIPLDVRELGVDFLSLSGHKFYGPKGVGALWIRRGLSINPQIWGGMQERGLRGGTQNVPLIVGIGAAAQQVLNKSYSGLLGELTVKFELKLEAQIPQVVIAGKGARRIPGTSFFFVPKLPFTGLASRLKGIAVSAGASCKSADTGGSHVLLSMGFKDTINCIRVSFGKENVVRDAKVAVKEILDALCEN